MIKSALLLPLVAGSMLLACSPQPENSQENAVSAKPTDVSHWPSAVNYEIFVQSFADSNGDGIGDLNGVTQKLDYLHDMGVRGLWFMPISPSPSYHKYDVTDYKGIHPDYGTLEDFKNLLAEAHKRDMKVIIDFVINHTAAEHPWFQDAITGPDAKYRNYYVWANYDSVASQIAKKTVTLDSDNVTQWHQARGNTQRYYGFFWGGMPDLNFDNPAVKKEIFSAGRFWLEDIGVDGFRLDAAKHIYPDERAKDNHAFWKEFRTAMEAIKPDVFLLGEVWTTADVAAPYLAGLHSLFNFDLGYAITRAVQTGRADSLVEKHQQIMNYYQGVTPSFVDATFLTNHDQNRIMSELGGDQQKAKAAAALLLTLPGTPFLYYGEELGMTGVKPDEHIREPFMWHSAASDSLRTSWMKPKYTTEQSVKPLSDQMRDKGSIYHHYRNLIHLRNSSQALTDGSLEPALSKTEGVISFMRMHENEQLMVLHNISDQAKKVQLVEVEQLFKNKQFVTNADIEVNDTTVTLPAYSAVVLQK